MSQSVDAQGWDRFKNVIRGLYMIKGHKLQGPEGVIEIMETQHGFKKSKAQYEKQFKDWGFKKNRSKRDWEIMNRKIQHRKRIGKESDVYLDGKLMPAGKLRKETSRQGYMTTLEQARYSIEASPQTPPGFDIRTPLEQPFYRLAFENLPIFQFHVFVQPVYGTTAIFNTSTPALAELFPGQSTNNQILADIQSLFPTSAFSEEQRAVGLTMPRAGRMGHAELLNLAIFMTSNNFLESAETYDYWGNAAKAVQKWLKTHGTVSVLRVLSSMRGPTVETLLENIFQFAIEDEDISAVKYLLRGGMNPNGHKCRLPSQFYSITTHSIDMSPLQFALFRGNTKLALELIKAGSTIDWPNTGWKSSALALAIIGDSIHGNKEYKAEDITHGADNSLDTQEATGHLFDLVKSLIKAGAAVNLGDIGQLRQTQSDMSNRRPRPLQYRQKFAIDLNEVHTPLSAASKHHQKAIVDLFIQNGADILFLTDQGTSALHECLYSRDQMRDDLTSGTLQPFRDRDLVPRRYKNIDTVLEVVRSLINAGANVHEEFKSRAIYLLSQDYSGLESYTIFDLGILTGSVEVFDLLMSSGANMTDLSVEFAIQVKSLDVLHRLLDAGALVSTGAVIIATRHHKDEFLHTPLWKIEHSWMKDTFFFEDVLLVNKAAVITTSKREEFLRALLTKREHSWIRETSLLEAIQLGHVPTIEYLFKDGTFSCRNILHMSAKLTNAIQKCCRHGHVNALRLILHNSLSYQCSLSPWFRHSLYLAISKGRSEVIDVLLSASTDVNAMAPKGETPLLAAIMTRNKEVFESLMGMGARLNPRAPSSTPCFSVHRVSGNALIAAIDSGDDVIVNRLLERGADIEAFGTAMQEPDDGTCKCFRPLTAALLAKNLDLVHDLIRRGVKINSPLDNAPIPVGSRIVTPTRMTPLAAAIEIRDYKMIDLIIREGANPCDRQAIIKTGLDWKIRKLLCTAIRRSHRPSNVESIRPALNYATKHRDHDFVDAILRGPLRGTKSRSFALDHTKHEISERYYVQNIYETVDMVMVFGADPNSYCPGGFMDTLCPSCFMNRGSALDMAAKDFNGSEMVRLLLEAGAEADTSKLFGRRYSPVQTAMKNKQYKAVQMLLDYGSNPNSVSIRSSVKVKGDCYLDDYRTPLQIAALIQNVEMVKILLKYKADVNGTVSDDDETEINKSTPYCRPRTPLQEASMGGSKIIAELLLDHGADVNYPPVTGNGATALQYAAMQGYLGIAHLLLEHGAKVNAPAAKTDGRTALEGAAEYGRVDMVQFLLNAGANIFGDGQAQYENAIRRASENGHHAIRRMLEKRHGEREE